MALQLSDIVENGRLDQIETTIGHSPTLEIRTGAQPVNCAAADSGTLLASMVLPNSWMADASGRSKVKSGTWQDLSVDATGTAGHFRIKQGATCHMQGSCGNVGSGADMELTPNSNLTLGQSFTVNTFTLNGNN
jgi:hypothetical protein